MKKNKAAILGGVALVVALYVYFTYFAGGSSGTLTATDQTSSVSQSLLVTLQNLHTIKLDPSIFSDPVYQSLTDFGVSIPPENVGRPNPFAPFSSSLGGSSSGSSGAAGLKLPSGAH